MSDLAAETTALLSSLGVVLEPGAAAGLTVKTPINGAAIATVATTSSEDLQVMLGRSKDAFAQWRQLPPPRRGELVRLLGEELRAAKEPLARLVTLEAGKILSEGAGEVQEMIDICDFAVGLSRQLYGKAIASERPGHHMIERWHPLGPVGVISAFNFPVAVWSWNATLALVCGNSLVWKPSDLTPLTALACQALLRRAMERFGDDAPPDLLQVVIGGQELGAQLAAAPELPLVSATGSTRMGRAVGPIVTGRFGRVLLELGGNNAAVIAPSADLDLAVRAVTFSAVGTCGQRCTSLRRLIVHRSVHEAMVERLKPVYAGLPIGSPLQDGTLVGPLISEAAGAAMDAALDQARAEGGTVHGGGPVAGLPPDLAGGCYRAPALVEMPGQTELVRTETFAPILYVLAYDSLDEAIALNNGVPQGLSSCIFANDLREAETFLSAVGSDCGIANVNIGPSGAEIGGAFGGEKETGGGREAGSDAWQAYMRRQTQTVNYSTALPLAQGVKFDI